MPHDLVIGDVYMPPLLAAGIVAMIAASLTGKLMRNTGVMAMFANPALVFFSLTVVYTVVLGSTLFPS